MLVPLNYIQRGDQSPEPDFNPEVLRATEVIHPLAKLHTEGSNQLSGQFSTRSDTPRIDSKVSVYPA